MLHPVQAAFADPVVRTAACDAPSASFSVLARTAAVFVSPRPPAQQLALLQGDVQGLVSAGALNGGQGRALVAKLEAARQQVLAGKLHPARGQLGAFLNQLDAFEGSGILSQAQADGLREQAQYILGVIGG